MSQTRSGKTFRRRIEADEEAVAVVAGARGQTRSGLEFRDTAGYYKSLAQLKKAHHRIFSPESSMSRVELPLSDSPNAILQAVLRISVADPNKTASIVKAYKQLDRLYPDSTFAVALSANVVLKHSTRPSYKLYFGQSYGSAKAIFAGQRINVEGKADRLFKEYSVGSVADAKNLPTQFNREDYGALFKQNFESSAVIVHSVVNLIYVFGLGLDATDPETVRKLKKDW